MCKYWFISTYSPRSYLPMQALAASAPRLGGPSGNTTSYPTVCTTYYAIYMYICLCIY